LSIGEQLRAGVVAALLMVGCASGQSPGDGGQAPERLIGEGILFPDGSRDVGPDPGDGWVPPIGSITVTSPAGGESWPAGSSQTITWTVDGSVGATVDLELWRGGTKHGDVATGEPNSGTYQWTISKTMPGGSDYNLRVVDQSNPAVFGTSSHFSIANWRYKVPITIDASSATSALSDFQVHVRLGSSFAYGHALPDGADLRFSTSPTLTGSFDLPHWIESWNDGGESQLWVLVPAIPAGTSSTIYLYYGNPDASSASDRDLTFPNRFESSGDTTMDGQQAFDWFQLKSSHTITLGAAKKLMIDARVIVIEGLINGNGRGHPGGNGVAGSGPGGGGKGTSAGGGGGGYGGKGGKGAHDGSDTPGVGGVANGTPGGEDLAMGSGGGGGASLSTYSGGAGGGAVELVGHRVQVSGTLRMDGAAGQGGAQSGGGGSGGGIKIKGVDVTLTGQLYAHGGKGGSGSSTANDGGGGGGGGRIKVLYENLISDTATRGVSGGAGGKYGDSADGVAGATGTQHAGQIQWNPAVTSVGAEQAL
jgi:hypothetical protein